MKNVINIHIRLINNDFKYEDHVIGTYNIEKNLLEYKENNIMVKLDIVNNVMTRENSEFKSVYKFEINKTTIGEMFVKDINKIVKLKIFTNNIIKGKNVYIISYNIQDDNTFTYELNYDK